LTHVTNVRECDSIVIWLNVHRFKDGLHAPGVFDAMKRRADIFEQLFCYSEQLLTATVMQQLFTPQLSAPGSNRRTAENLVLAWWLDCLLDVEGKLILLIA